jgi:Kef-type K+ transport system membrane component KefB
MNEALASSMWLVSPLAVLGAGLMLAFVVGLTLQRAGLPQLYGAVIAGLLLGTSGAGLVDAPLLAQFQELFNAASALVLFEVGRKMDLQWLMRSGRPGLSLVLATIVRGLAVTLTLALVGVGWGAAIFIGAMMVAVNPVIFSSMVSDTNASGTATFATANMVGLSNLVALLALGFTLAWTRSQGVDADVEFWPELARQAGKLLAGIVIAVICYGLYALATRLCRARAAMRPGMLLAALLIDLGLCSISASSALVSLLLMGILLRNVEKRDNVFQAQLKTVQDIGYVLLFMMSAALVDISQLMNGAVFGIALCVFVVRIGATRISLIPGHAWSKSKKDAMALSMCSLVGYGALVVDNSMNAYTGLDDMSNQIMAALLAMNVLFGPGLTWWGLRLAGETHQEPRDE